MTLKNILQIDNDDAEFTLRYINLSLSLIPSCLRICDSYFTTLVLVGDKASDGEIPLHTDDKNIVSDILNLGDHTLSGVSTVFTNGVNTNVKGDVVRMEHCN